MLCEICHKKEGEWQCQTCRRVVCTEDVRPTSAGVFCIDHAPRQYDVSPKIKTQDTSTTDSIKSAFITLLFLTIGMGAIIFIGLQSVNGASVPEQIRPMIESLKTTGTLIIGFMGFLTIILGIAWFALRRR